MALLLRPRPMGAAGIRAMACRRPIGFLFRGSSAVFFGCLRTVEGMSEQPTSDERCGICGKEHGGEGCGVIDVCDACAGSGMDETASVDCEHCGGEGFVLIDDDEELHDEQA